MRGFNRIAGIWREDRGQGLLRGLDMSSERFRAPPEWTDEQVAEAIWMLRLGKACAYVADCMRVYDEVIVRMGWALRATGVDVQGLHILPREPERVSPPAPAPVPREPRLPAYAPRERPREKVLAVS
jgi:hypothetical protein